MENVSLESENVNGKSGVFVSNSIIDKTYKIQTLYEHQTGSHKVSFQDNYIELSTNDFDTYVLHPWAWKETELKTPSYVYVVPLLALVIIIINVIVVYVFIREKMLSTTNVLLIGIAVSDTLTVTLPSPLLLYLYSSGDAPFIPYNLCRVWDYITKNAPTITHTSSIWLTVCLAVHRYLSICHPFLARRHFTKRKCATVMTFVYILSFLFHFCRFIDTKYIAVRIVNSTHSALNMSSDVATEDNITCHAVHVDALQGHSKIIYECIYYWLYIVFVIFIPIGCLITTSFMLIRSLRRSDSLALKFAVGGHSKSFRRKRNERMTKLIVCIVFLVTLVEILTGTILILWTVSMIYCVVQMPIEILNNPSLPVNFTNGLISEDVLGDASVATNLIMYISYPIIFILYCLMSNRFYNAVKSLFRCYRFPGRMNKPNSEQHSIEIGAKLINRHGILRNTRNRDLKQSTV